MLPVEMLAASTRPLADVLIDRLRAAGRRRSLLDRLRRRRDDEEDWSSSELMLPLLQDEEDCGRYEPPLRPLRPDETAAAILVGRALDQNRDVLRRLQDITTITIIEVTGPDWVDLVERVVRDFVLGGDVAVIDGDRCEGGDDVASPGSVILFSRDAETGKKALSQGNLALGAAVQRQAAIVGIAADPERTLPSDLVKLADHRIELPALDADAVAAVIEAVTGTRPPAVDEELAHSITVDALLACVRSDLGAKRSLTRLRRMLHRNPSASAEPRLADLHGLGAARAWGEALVADLHDYKAGRLSANEVPKACLLTGAPGVGKTTFARALGKSAGIHVVATSYNSWQSRIGSGHLGDVIKAIRSDFAEARRHKPAIIFIDEIDTIPARGRTSHNSDWWTAICNCLLEELDGFDRSESAGVIVLAACNNPDRLDPALVRSGRLDRHIEIPLPDHPALVGIFRMHLATDLAGVDLRLAALAARGHTGADVERWVREARRAARKAARPLTLQDLLDAVRGGAPDWPADVRRRIGYHEAGHAIAQRSLGTGDPTAISINGGGGLSEASFGEIRALTREYLEKHLAALLAGRAAELLVFGDATAGAGGGADSDLARATRLALQIEAAFGLGHAGPLWLGEATTPRDLLLMPDLRAAVRQTIDTAQAAATDLLTCSRPALDALAQALFAQGYLDRGEIAAVLADTPLTPTDMPRPHSWTSAAPHRSAESRSATNKADGEPTASEVTPQPQQP